MIGYRGGTVGEAFMRSMLAGPLPAEPIFWAPFSLIGDGG